MVEKAIDYCHLIVSDSIDELNKKVNDALRNGLQPYKGHKVERIDKVGFAREYSQIIVNYEEPIEIAISHYKVISSGGADGLEEEVRKAIDDGWQPFDGHQVKAIDGYGLVREYSQTLVKYEILQK